MKTSSFLGSGRTRSARFLARLAPLLLLSLFLSAPSSRAEVIQNVALQVYGTGPVKTVTVAGNSSRLAVAGPSVVHIYSLSTGEKIKSVTGHIGEINAASLSHNGQLLATCAGRQPLLYNDAAFDPSARVWVADTGELLWSFIHPEDVTAVALSPDATQLVTGSDDFKLRRFDLASGDLLQEWAAHSAGITSLSFSPDGTKILSASKDRFAKLWNAADGSPFATLSGNAAAVNAAAFSANGSRIVLGSSDYTARVYDASDGSLIRTIFGNTTEVLSAAISPDGSTVLTGDKGGYAYSWNVSTGAKVSALPRHGGAVTSIYFSPNGTRVATGGGYGDQAGHLWSFPDFQPIIQTAGHPGVLLAADFEAAGASFLTVGDHVEAVSYFTAPSRVLSWETDSGKLRFSSPSGGSAYYHRFTDVASDPDGNSFITGHSSNLVQLWDSSDPSTTPSLIRSLPFYSDSVEMIGNQFALSASGSVAYLWDLTSDTLKKSFLGHTGAINDVQPGPFLARIATASQDGSARVWDAQSGQLIALLTGIGSYSNAVAFSPGGSRLAVATIYGSRYVSDPYGNYYEVPLGGHWDLNSGAFLHEFLLKSQYSNLEGGGEVSYAPSGGEVAIGCTTSGIAAAWDASSGELRRLLRGHQGKISAAKYSPDGQRLLTTSQDGTARLWAITKGPEIPAPPQFVLQPRSMRLKEGHSAILCAEAVGPGPIEMAWRRRGGVHAMVSSRSGQSVVRISDADLIHGGEWYCVASGPGGVVTSAPASIEFAYSENAAGFQGDTVPDTLSAGQGIWAGITYGNASYPSWSAPQGFALAIIDDPGGLFEGATKIDFNDPCTVIQPDETAVFNAFIKAPLTPGSYTAKAQMMEEGVEFFGEIATITVNVVPRPNAAETWTGYE